MFSFFPGSAISSRHDLDVERVPPAKPTPVTFPDYDKLIFEQAKWLAGSAPRLRETLAELKKPGEANVELLKALNIKIILVGGFEALIPDAGDFLPPVEWLDSKNSGEARNSSSNIFNTPGPAPGAVGIQSSDAPNESYRDWILSQRIVFQQRLSEISIENDEAFNALNRTTASQKKPASIKFSRRFWHNLETMAAYWDASKDRYYVDDPVIEGDVEEQKTPADDEVGVAIFGPNVDPPKIRYRGQRIGCGADMPEITRLETVRSFIEFSLWNFNLTFHNSKRQPSVLIDRLILPIRLSSIAWQGVNNTLGQNRELVRTRQGPVIGLQCRDDVEFDHRESAHALQDASLDVLMELGALLCLAQERDRQGKTWMRPGEGSWWNEPPVWSALTESRAAQAPVKEHTTPHGGNMLPHETFTIDNLLKPRHRSSLSRKMGPIKRTNERSATYTDPQVDYSSVGKPRGSDYDDVYMVSSLNHHISVLRLRVHSAYLDYLVTAKFPNPEPDDARWCAPVLYRSRWFDLLSRDDRREAFRGIWGLTTYLAREQAITFSSK